MLGGIQIRTLYGDLVNNGDLSAKDFYDQILQNGSMSIEMVKKPPKDYETNGRFYESLE